MMTNRPFAGTWIFLLPLVITLSSCVDRDYDFSKMDDKVHLHKSVCRIDGEIPFPAPVFTAYGQTHYEGSGKFTLTLNGEPDGFLLGEVQFPMYNKSNAYAKKAEMTVTILSDIPYEMEATVSAVEYDETAWDAIFPFKPVAGVTATPGRIRIIPGKETPYTVSFTSGSAFHCESVGLKLTTAVQTLVLDENQQISFKDLKINYPEGVDIY